MKPRTSVITSSVMLNYPVGVSSPIGARLQGPDPQQTEMSAAGASRHLVKAAPAPELRYRPKRRSESDVTEPENDQGAAYLQALGAAVKARRERKKWTVRYIAAANGFEHAKWQGYQDGCFEMSVSVMVRVAGALGMHPSELLASAEQTITHKPVRVGYLNLNQRLERFEV